MKSTGKKELTIFIQYINDNNIRLPNEMKSSLKHLIFKWRKKNKTTDDFFSIKNDNIYISSFFENMRWFDKSLVQLWNNYIDISLSYRIQRIEIEHPNHYII